MLRKYHNSKKQSKIKPNPKQAGQATQTIKRSRCCKQHDESSKTNSDYNYLFKGNGQSGVYPLLLWSDGGIGKIRQLEAHPRAPNCPKFSSDALARCPQPLPSTHTFSSFSSTLLGQTGPRRTSGLRDPPFWPRVGGACPRKSSDFVHYPSVTSISPHLTEIIPLHYHLRQPRNQAQTNLHVTVQQPE